MEKTHRFYYGWVIVGVSFLTLFFTHGIPNSFGVFYVAMLQDYGWGRGETAGAFSLAMVIHAFFSIVTGALIDRFGPRTLFPLGATLLAMGLAAALGAYLGGYFHDQVGSYTLPFLLVLISICLGILGIWMAAPRHRRTPSVSQAG